MTTLDKYDDRHIWNKTKWNLFLLTFMILFKPIKIWYIKKCVLKFYENDNIYYIYDGGIIFIHKYKWCKI